MTFWQTIPPKSRAITKDRDKENFSELQKRTEYSFGLLIGLLLFLTKRRLDHLKIQVTTNMGDETWVECRLVRELPAEKRGKEGEGVETTPKIGRGLFCLDVHASASNINFKTCDMDVT